MRTKDKKRVIITAIDRIGRTESITLILDSNTAGKLVKSANLEYPDGAPYSDLVTELGELYDSYKYHYDTRLSSSQFYKLRNFYGLIYHKFYNYTLSIECK